MSRNSTSRGRFAIALAVTTAFAVTAGPHGAPIAEAAPSVWAKVRNPSLQRQSDLAAQVDSLLYKYGQLEQADRPSGMAPALHEARRLLEQGGAAESQDLHLRLRLAEVLEGLEQAGKAAAVLESIIRANPPAPLLADALQTLAVCYARLGRHDDEIKAYAEALARQPHPSARAVLLANRAEAYMALGRLSEAIQGYQQALSIASATPIQMIMNGLTTLWGLAVATDRNGDLEGALQAIALARTYDPTDVRLRRNSGWFFVPSYDEAWYGALGHWLAARQTDLEAVRMDAYEKAIASWERYLAAAPDTGHWTAIAKARLLTCEKERDLAMNRAAHKPARAAHPGTAHPNDTSERVVLEEAPKRAVRKPKRKSPQGDGR